MDEPLANHADMEVLISHPPDLAALQRFQSHLGLMLHFLSTGESGVYSTVLTKSFTGQRHAVIMIDGLIADRLKPGLQRPPRRRPGVGVQALACPWPVMNCWDAGISPARFRLRGFAGCAYSWA